MKETKRVFITEVETFAVDDLRWGATPEQLDYLRAIESGYPRVGICEPLGFGASFPPMMSALYRAMFSAHHLTIVAMHSKKACLAWMEDAQHLFEVARYFPRGTLTFIEKPYFGILKGNTQKVVVMLASDLAKGLPMMSSEQELALQIVLDPFDHIAPADLKSILAFGATCKNAQTIVVSGRAPEPKKPVEKPSIPDPDTDNDLD